eukprot:14112916-Ditylum_brightwellii.AAC.1
MPMPDSVIKQVERQAEEEGQDGEITFTNRAGEEFAAITNANQYEDWPTEAKDQITTLESYNEVNYDDDEHAGPQQTTTDPEIGPPLLEEVAPPP